MELGDDKVPDDSTILRFRHLLEREGLTEGIFEAVKDLLAEKRMMLRAGTIVDATIISAPSSTKNQTKSRDPEMKQTRKGKNWHFGLKLHIGTDRRGLVPGLTATHAAASDISQLEHLLHGEETVLYGDQAYWERVRSPGVRRERHPPPGQPPDTGWEQEPERALAKDQSGSLSDTGSGRASVPRDQAAMGIREDALSGDREEPGPSPDDVRVGQPLRRATQTDAIEGDVRSMIKESIEGPLRTPYRASGKVCPLINLHCIAAARRTVQSFPGLCKRWFTSTRPACSAEPQL